MSDSDGPDAFDEIFDEDFVNGLDASHDDDSDIHVITAPPTNLFRFDEPEDEVLQGHPSRSSGYVDPLINDQYLYGHRLFDLTALRLKDFTKPSVAAEKVWDIPELRLIIVENVAGPKEKSTLRNILLTDKRGFGAAMPVLYRSMLDELHSYICYMNSPPVSTPLFLSVFEPVLTRVTGSTYTVHSSCTRVVACDLSESAPPTPWLLCEISRYIPQSSKTTSGLSRCPVGHYKDNARRNGTLFLRC